MGDPRATGPVESTAIRDGHRLAGRYRLESRIGGGGMADVWSAHDERLDRSVAVKILRADRIEDPQVRRRFAHEGRAAARLSHPNVVSVYDVGEESGAAFLVMELIAGETLADRIGRGRLDPLEVRRIGLDLLAGLGAVHAAGILHRDIKPGNVLLAGDGAKLADFGIAKSNVRNDVDATATSLVIGTPGYLPPERAAGGPATPASDVWSVGVLLYEALTGVRPFRGPTPLAVALAARHGEFAPVDQYRPGVDRALVQAIERSLAPEPAARFAGAAAMADAIRRGGPARGGPGNPAAGADRGRPAFAPVAPTPPDPAGPLGPSPGPVTPTRIAPTTAEPAARRSRGSRRRVLAVGGGVAVVAAAALAVWAVADRGGGSGARPPATTVPHAAVVNPTVPPTFAPTTGASPATTRTTPTTAPGHRGHTPGPGKSGRHPVGHGPGKNTPPTASSATTAPPASSATTGPPASTATTGPPPSTGPTTPTTSPSGTPSGPGARTVGLGRPAADALSRSAR
jgi:tRNA A-37 threonylcarbamoyl transferase component Bud32